MLVKMTSLKSMLLSPYPPCTSKILSALDGSSTYRFEVPIKFAILTNFIINLEGLTLIRIIFQELESYQGKTELLQTDSSSSPGPTLRLAQFKNKEKQMCQVEPWAKLADRLTWDTNKLNFYPDHVT